MKGFLGGVSIGTLVAVAGAAMWSLSTPLPTGVQVDTTTPDAALQPEEESSAAPQAEERRDADLVEATPTSPQVSDGSDASPLATLDMSPGERPVIASSAGASQGDLSQGEDIATLPQLPGAVTAEQVGAAAPDAPGEEADVIVSAETIAPPAPQTPATENATPQTAEQMDGGSEAAGESPDADVATAVVTPNETRTDTAIAPTVPATRPVTVPATATAPSGPQIGSAPEATALPNIAGVSDAPTQGEATPGGQGAAEVDPVLAGEAENQNEQPDSVGTSGEVAAQVSSESPQPSTNSLPTTEEGATDSRAQSPQIGTRVVPLTERNNTSSLVGAGAETGAETGANTGSVTAEAGKGRPFEDNAQAFAGFEDRPLMSIVLIDDETAIGAEALAEFPYPLSFAIDPKDPKAAEKMQARRDAGFEVLILADLPREAAPQDAETTMAVWMDRLPLAVGILEGVETGFQGNRPLADQMVAVLQDAGFGMVTQNSGLNTVQKLALRDGMPSGVVFRDFDGAGQNPRAIRRFLDQAAFRARQEGAVIMLGRLRPATISALLLWGLQDRASQVGLAPISAGLKANLNPDG